MGHALIEATVRDIFENAKAGYLERAFSNGPNESKAREGTEVLCRLWRTVVGPDVPMGNQRPEDLIRLGADSDAVTYFAQVSLNKVAANQRRAEVARAAVGGPGSDRRVDNNVRRATEMLRSYACASAPSPAKAGRVAQATGPVPMAAAPAAAAVTKAPSCTVSARVSDSLLEQFQGAHKDSAWTAYSVWDGRRPPKGAPCSAAGRRG